MTSTQQSTSILRSLRLLMPDRQLTFEEAKQRAELQANRVLELTGVHSPSVPLEIITELPHIRLGHDADLPTSGLTHWDGHAWIIMINAAEGANRQRFSLMHEFKHVLDHPYRHRYPHTASMSAAQFAELVADYFAACVLMPKRWVKTAFYGGTQSVEELARLFDVSSAAMKYRLDDLGLSSSYRCRTTTRSAGYHRESYLTGAL